MKFNLNPDTWKWIKTTLIAVLGGGLAAALAAAFDPQKYDIRHDIGSGKLWQFFLEGAGAMLVGLLIKSPLGQQALTSFKDSQQQLQEAKASLEQTKTDLKSSVAPKQDPPK